MYQPAFPQTLQVQSFCTSSALCRWLEMLRYAVTGLIDQGEDRNLWLFTSWAWMGHTQACLLKLPHSCITSLCVSGWAIDCFSSLLDSLSVYGCLLLHRKTQPRLMPIKGLPAVRLGWVTESSKLGAILAGDWQKLRHKKTQKQTTFGTLQNSVEIVLNYKSHQNRILDVFFSSSKLSWLAYPIMEMCSLESVPCHLGVGIFPLF